MCLGVDAPGHFAPRRSSRYHAYCNPRIMFFCLRKNEKTFSLKQRIKGLVDWTSYKRSGALWRFYYGKLYSNCGSSLTLSESNKDLKLEVWSTGFTGRGVLGWGSGDLSHCIIYRVNQIHTAYGYCSSRFTPTACVSHLGSKSSKYTMPSSLGPYSDPQSLTSNRQPNTFCSLTCLGWLSNISITFQWGSPHGLYPTYRAPRNIFPLP